MTIDKGYVLAIDSPVDIFNWLFSGDLFAKVLYQSNSILRIEENSQKVESRNIFTPSKVVEFWALNRLRTSHKFSDTDSEHFVGGIFWQMLKRWKKSPVHEEWIRFVDVKTSLPAMLSSCKLIVSLAGDLRTLESQRLLHNYWTSDISSNLAAGLLNTLCQNWPHRQNTKISNHTHPK